MAKPKKTNPNRKAKPKSRKFAPKGQHPKWPPKKDE